MAGASSHSQPTTHRNNTPGHESPAKKLSLESPIPPTSAQSDATMSDTTQKEKKPQQQGGRSSQVKTPEPRTSKERINGQRDPSDRSPSTPGHLAPFDWDDFEARYEEALADADREEQELLKEFEDLVKVGFPFRLSARLRLVFADGWLVDWQFFNVWASAASVNDSERGVKRLQTRERHVRLAEQSLSQKKKHRESFPLVSCLPSSS
ncbi:hypothetical protein VTJ49DRAFT_6337 [Mycothermus thermophilus]|uniref:Uncharacterized protein n=1 Tax=Humicola insolens TaxID=85995 RepID=A0ABR3V1E7_HUMIN